MFIHVTWNDTCIDHVLVKRKYVKSLYITEALHVVRLRDRNKLSSTIY